MTEINIRVEATTDEAEKKLKRVDEKIVKLEKGAHIKIELPTIDQTINAVETLGKTLAETAKTALSISRAMNMGPGAVINDLDDLFGIVVGKGRDAISVMEMLGKATPTKILTSSLNAASDGAANLAKSLSNIGYEVFGLTQSVSILKQSFGGFFDETIGREIKLQESLLRTRTTLVSTADVMRNGVRLTDPFEALTALEKPIDQTLENIRRRSLDIAGTTSDAIIQVFGVVASQVGAIGGSLKDAEDLAITFAGALGTIGMSDPTLATQEIRSILTGNIDQNSVLARSLGLTNEEIAKAKNSADGLVSFLTKRLGAFSAGQKLAAQGFSGIVSNIAEVREEASRTFGKPLLAPLLEGLTALYTRLQLVFKQILGIADGLGRIGAASLGGIVSSIGAAPILQNVTGREQIGAFKSTEDGIAKAAVGIQAAIDKIRPLIANLANEAIKAFAMVSSGLINLAKGFVSFKFEQIKIQINAFLGIARVLNSSVVPALTMVLDLYGKILSQPIFQALAQINVQLQVLEKVGVLPVMRLGYYINSMWGSVKIALGWIGKFINAIKTGVSIVVDAVANSISGITSTISAAGKGIVQIVSLIVQSILVVISTVVKQIGVSLVAIGAQIQAEYPKLSEVAVAVAGIGKAFINVEKTVAAAGLSIQGFSQQAVTKLGGVALAGQRAAEATRNLGTTISGALMTGIKSLGKGLLGTFIGFVKFQAGLFLLEKGLGAVSYLVSRYSIAQQEISDQTQTELALKRLSTAYLDLGENASAAAKALREADLEQAKNRSTALKSKITEIAPQYKAAAAELSKIEARYKAVSAQNKANVVGTIVRGVGNANDRAGIAEPVLPFGSFTPSDAEVGAAKGKYQRLRKEYSSYINQLNSIDSVLRKQAEGQKAEDDVRIIAKERKDLEVAIGELRKQIAQELKEDEFKTAREVAQLQQSLREESRRVERAELDRQLARQNEGLTGVQAEMAQILGDYEKGLFDNQTEAQRKQFEAAQARENLEKSIADYKLKLEEQTIRLRKRMGDYNQKVSDYVDAAEKRRNAERLETEVKAAAIRTEGFITQTPDETKAWNQAADNVGTSASLMLTLAKLPSTPALFGLPAGNTQDDFQKWMKRLIDKGIKPSIGLFEAMARRYGGILPGAVPALYDASVNELGNQRYSVPKPAPPVKVTGFSDLTNTNSESVAAIRRSRESVETAQQRLRETIGTNNDKENLANTVAKLEKSGNFSNLPSPQEAYNLWDKTNKQLKLAKESIKSGTGAVSAFASGMLDLQVSVSEGVKIFADQRMADVLKGDALKQAKADLVASIGLSLQEEKPMVTDAVNKLKGDLPKLILALVTGIFKDFNNTRYTLDAIRKTQELAKINEVRTSIPDIKRQTASTRFQLATEYGKTSNDNDPLKSRQFEAELQIFNKRLELASLSNQNQEEANLVLAEFSESTRNSAKELGLFEQSMLRTTERLALIKDISKDYVDGMKSLVLGLRDGKDLSEITSGMMNNISDRITGAFLDFAFKPVQDTMENMLKKILPVTDPAELFKSEQTRYMSAVMADIETAKVADKLWYDLDVNTNSLIKGILDKLSELAPGAVPAPQAKGIGGPDLRENADTSGLPFGYKIGDQVGGNAPMPSSSGLVFPQGSLQFLNALPAAGMDMSTLSASVTDLTFATSTASEVIQGFSANLAAAAVAAPAAAGAPAGGPVPGALNNIGKFQKTLGGVMGIAAGIGTIVGGIGTMKKKGTYNKLMGLGSIFLGVGTVVSQFSPGAAFGKRERGGPVFANRPYIVGEKRPELFVPSSNGTIIPSVPGGKSDPTAAAQADLNRQMFNSERTSNELEFTQARTAGNSGLKVETIRMGNMNVVTEEQMLQAVSAAEQRGAKQGESRVFRRLKNDTRIPGIR